ncbi:MATE efflux family protein [Nitzschia inconspicua]|uniref:MATE efflux family protein n=1 Tax=Nitzschia inconspicua TaxID=303405 RepID=A0A9K3K7A8_9STRA|nr:MATE efflux family protein [Nitzschia inconspicua]KAG7360809.1 MATE efflux family protein [Nitzschia inconspicua]
MAWNNHQQQTESSAANESTPLIVPTALVVKDGLEVSEDDSSAIAIEPRYHSISEDVIDTVKLGVPIFIAMLSWVGMKTTDTALLGHVSANALSAAALSDLWTMCSAMLVQGRILDILVGGAVGAGNPRLAGIYLQVAYVVISCVAVLVILCWNLTELVWIKFGTDPEIAKMAGYYASVLSISIPGQIIFGQLSQFFSAQRIMHPEVNSSTLSLCCNMLFGLIFVLGIPIPGWTGFGFKACPIVTTCVVYVQIISMWYIYIHKQRLHQAAWGGWAWDEITWSRIITFSSLYFPSAFGIASDFWRVAAIGIMAAQIGDEEVAVFNTSYRLMWIVLVCVMAVGGASGINMSMRLGSLDHVGARQAGLVGVGLSSFICILIGVVVWANIRAFGRIFTDDELFLRLFHEARTPFAITLIFMNMSIAIEKIPYSMGRTYEVFWMGFLASWGAQVPAVYLCTTYWRNDLTGLYTGMCIGYGVLVILYSAIASMSDWKKYAKLAYQRSESNIDSSKMATDTPQSKTL